MPEYWDYYDDDVSWPVGFLPPDLAATHAALADVGLSSRAIDSLIRSGYSVFPYAEGLLIDRYYGGALRSSDTRTRVRVEHVPAWLDGQAAASAATSTARPNYFRASSREEMLDAIQGLQALVAGGVLYRGQIDHYSLTREVPNQYVAVPGLGEVSLLPGIWRRMIASGTESRFTDFYGATAAPRPPARTWGTHRMAGS